MTACWWLPARSMMTGSITRRIIANAAMVVDSTALNRASAALEAHNSVVAEQNALYRDMIRISSEIGGESGGCRRASDGREIFNRRN